MGRPCFALGQAMVVLRASALQTLLLAPAACQSRPSSWPGTALAADGIFGSTTGLTPL